MGSYLIGYGPLLVQLRAPLLGTVTEAEKAYSDETWEGGKRDVLAARAEVLSLGAH